MVVAAIGAAGIGQVFDGALLIVIFATSGALEAIATKRTADSVRSLLDLAPATTTRLTATGEQAVDTAVLEVGDVILVRPGERIGGDGKVIDGGSEVDQATITGEPLPVDKQVGDEVFAGTLNGTGALRVRVTRPAGDTVIARIVAMVAEASATKARTQLFIEKIEQRYSVGMVAATLALFLIPLAFGAELRPTLLRAMTFMIVASPCAVVLATMPPLLSAIANAARHGVLVKSAVVLEHLGTATRVAFDKTGTLTAGTPRLAETRPLSGTGMTATELLALAAAAENPSGHPPGRGRCCSPATTRAPQAGSPPTSASPTSAQACSPRTKSPPSANCKHRARMSCWSATASTTPPPSPPPTPGSPWAAPDPTSHWTPRTRSSPATTSRPFPPSSPSPAAPADSWWRTSSSPPPSSEP
jgi:cation-transporting P-type ATPase J